jgi:hypothetical protein
MLSSGGTQLQTRHLQWLDPVSQTKLGALQRLFVRTPCILASRPDHYLLHIRERGHPSGSLPLAQWR